MRISVSASLALTLLSTPALAADPAKPPKEKRVCKRSDEGTTGSNLRKWSAVVCRPASEWRELEDNTERLLRESRERGGAEQSSSPSAGPNPGPN